MDPLGDPLTTRPIQTGWEFTMEPYPSWQFGFIDHPDRQFGNGSVWTRTRTRNDGLEPLLTLHRMSIQQPDCLIKTLVFKFVVDCTENRIEYWACICWIEDLLTILRLLLNLPCPLVCVRVVLNHLSQFFGCKRGRWAHIEALLKLIRMLGISQTSNHSNKYVRMQYNQFYPFIQNLH